MIAMRDANTAEFMFYRNPGADTRLASGELDTDLLGQTHTLHFGSLSLTDEPARSATHAAAEIARQGGALISFDANYRPHLWINPAEAALRIRAVMDMVDVLKVNESELNLLAGTTDPIEGSRILLKGGPSLVLATLGAQGSYFRSQHGADFVPAFAVEALDATGCGDAFMAGVLARLTLSHEDWRTRLDVDSLREIVRYGSAVGALTALAYGVIPALPTAREVELFLESQGFGSG
jgi:fructokinase